VRIFFGIMSEPRLRATLYAIAAVQIAAGLVAWVSPSTLFDGTGGFGAQNDHYIRFIAAGLIAPGIALAIAARRSSWRVPLLTVGAILNGLLALNQALDLGDASSDARGVLGLVGFAVTAVGAAYLARESARLSG
jgi:uncharacterized protein DUF4345